jgi:ABC-2 type transport system permease protein
MNLQAIRAIYKFEMNRTRRTLAQSIVAPVISTSLYFVVFGAALGSRITEIEGVRYGAFIVPGLIMLTLLTSCSRRRSRSTKSCSAMSGRRPASRSCWG